LGNALCKTPHCRDRDVNNAHEVEHDQRAFDDLAKEFKVDSHQLMTRINWRHSTLLHKIRKISVPQAIDPLQQACDGTITSGYVYPELEARGEFEVVLHVSKRTR
jgi:hypothetical protein